MKTKIGSLAVAVSWLMVTHVAVAQANLEVVVKNVKDGTGNIRVGLFANEKEFLKKAVFGKVVKATPKGDLTVVFENLSPGEYAVSIIHDSNENGELDSNAFGIPKEGFAFGNNAMGTFGPPSFEKAKVVINKTSVKQVIEMRYF